MSNRVCLEPTEFVNVRSGSKSLGYRLYDEYGSTYNNNFESIPDDDLELLEMVINGDKDDFVRDLLSFLKEEEKGIDIGGTWYDYDEIKHLL